MRRPLYKLSIAILLLSGSAALEGAEVHAQSDGPFEALTWSVPASDANLLTRGVNVGGVFRLDYELGQQRAAEMDGNPEGRQAFMALQTSLYIIRDGWAEGRDNPNDRIIGSTLDEDIPGEDRTSITVAPLNFAMSGGEKIWIQTGDPSNPPLTESDVTPAYLTADAAQGATTLSIDDGNGNPVTITASQDDRVLSNTQSPWIIHAKQELANKFDDFLQGFVDAGGPEVDVIYLDTEAGIPTTQRMSQDPRWDNASMGLDGKSLKQFVEDGPYTLQELIDAGTGEAASNWDAANFTGKILSDAKNEALFDVVTNYFPNIKGSDYSETGVTKENSVIDTDNNERWTPHVFGTHGSHPLYASGRQIVNNDPRGTIGSSLGTHPYGIVNWQVRYVRGMHQSTGGKVMPWLTYENLVDSFFSLEVRDTPYYEEHVRHIALHTDSEVPVLYWNARDGGNGGGDDQQDLNFNSVLEGLNSQISADSYQTVTTQKPDWTTDIFATAIETPNKRLWRVTVMRVDPKGDRDIVVNVSNGDTVIIPGGSVGAWYETAKGVDVTFSYQHPPVDNLLPDDTWIDFQSNKYNIPSGVTKVSDPDGGMDAYEVSVNEIGYSNDISLSEGDYTLSFWGKTGNNNAQVIVQNTQGERKASEGLKSGREIDDTWVRRRIEFSVGSSETGIQLKFGGNRASLQLYQPMINEGKRAGPYASPEAPSPGSQEISLQKGGNLVSTAVDPTYPDLETVLGDATSSIARIETQDGQVFDPSEGTDEIGTWDPTEAYTIYAEEPTSFDVEGTVLDAKDVSLDAGWNWLPHLGSTSVPVDQAFDTIQNDLVMVKDETGRVYRPAQGTDQIGSLEPGAAYKILLENPVTLSYPLE